jgi:hypothetical protein
MPSLHGAGQREIHNDFRIAPFGRNDTADFFYALQNDHQTLFIKKTTNPTSYPNHGVIDHSRHLSTLQVALGFDEQMIETFIQLLIMISLTCQMTKKSYEKQKFYSSSSETAQMYCCGFVPAFRQEAWIWGDSFSSVYDMKKWTDAPSLFS